MKKILLFSLLIIFVGCSNEETSESVVQETSISEMFTTRDMDESYYHEDYEEIEVTSDIEITEEGTYVLSGNVSEATITVNTEGKVQLVLNNLEITNTTESAIYVENAEKVFITLGEDSTNVLSITESTEADAVIESRDDLTINGTGSLEISSTVKGISSNDDLKITNGEYVINSQDHGLDANNSVRIAKGSINITSGSDGIHSEEEEEGLGFVYIENGDLEINSVNDGISSYTYTEIVDGNFTITTDSGSVETAASQGFGPGGQNESSQNTTTTESAKAIKAGQTLTINGGNFTLDSNDDGLHSDDSLVINGGSFDIKSSDDGIHANNSLIIYGGNINISRSYEGLESADIKIEGGEIAIVASDDGINAGTSVVISEGTLNIIASGDGIDSNGDVEVNGGSTIIESVASSGNYALDYDGSASITGGEFMAFGLSGMEVNFTNADQGTILLSTSSMQTGEVSVTSSDGEIVSYSTDASFNSVIISSASMSSGNTYSVNIGNQTSSITLSGNIYGESRGMGGPR
ncbi:MAG: carbohydrate-binding domain-containing protein [Bacilli bacterium]